MDATPTAGATPREDCKESQNQVPLTSEIVAAAQLHPRPDEDSHPLTGAKHTPDEYDAAKLEPIVIRPQVSATWRAPQFVWQVREALAQILCPDNPTDCEEVDTGGYRVTTTLDWDMQKTVEKWVLVAARAPAIEGPTHAPAGQEDPEVRVELDPRLRGRNIHNARVGRHGLPDRRGAARTSAAPATRPRATRSSSPSSTCCRTAGASPDRRSSRSMIQLAASRTNSSDQTTVVSPSMRDRTPVPSTDGRAPRVRAAHPQSSSTRTWVPFGPQRCADPSIAGRAPRRGPSFSTVFCMSQSSSSHSVAACQPLFRHTICASA